MWGIRTSPEQRYKNGVPDKEVTHYFVSLIRALAADELFFMLTLKNINII